MFTHWSIYWFIAHFDLITIEYDMEGWTTLIQKSANNLVCVCGNIFVTHTEASCGFYLSVHFYA